MSYQRYTLFACVFSLFLFKELLYNDIIYSWCVCAIECWPTFFGLRPFMSKCCLHETPRHTVCLLLEVQPKSEMMKFLFYRPISFFLSCFISVWYHTILCCTMMYYVVLCSVILFHTIFNMNHFIWLADGKLSSLKRQLFKLE